MKTLLRIAILLVAAGAALATGMGRFISWEYSTKNNPDIVVIESKLATAPPRMWLDGLVESDGEVISVLKGTMKPGLVKLGSRAKLHEGYFYLVFGYLQRNNVPQTIAATDIFQVVRLRSEFRTNDLTGKQLEEQIQALLRYRYEDQMYENQNRMLPIFDGSSNGCTLIHDLRFPPPRAGLTNVVDFSAPSHNTTGP